MSVGFGNEPVAQFTEHDRIKERCRNLQDMNMRLVEANRLLRAKLDEANRQLRRWNYWNEV